VYAVTRKLPLPPRKADSRERLSPSLASMYVFALSVMLNIDLFYFVYFVFMQLQKAGNEVQHDFDEGVRPDTTVEKLATLDTLVPNGRITAGNASQIRLVRYSFDIQTREHDDFTRLVLFAVMEQPP
jgi:hypothetical protein